MQYVINQWFGAGSEVAAKEPGLGLDGGVRRHYVTQEHVWAIIPCGFSHLSLPTSFLACFSVTD